MPAPEKTASRPCRRDRRARRRPARRAPAVAVGALAALSALGMALTACSSPSGGASAPSGSAASPGATAPPGSAGALALQNAFVGVIKRLLPSVVEIRTSSGLGSGVVFDGKGDIVTNAHVVGTATSFQVLQSSSAKPLSATLVGAYPPDDLAVIKVSGGAGLRPATFGDSSKLQVGDIVLAIGSPLGLSSSATDGIVSAVGRVVPEPAEGGSPGATLPDTIQTSAAINPGNSGGALVDLAGHVVGIPTLAATDQQLGGGAAPGIGFAISSNMAVSIARQLVATGHVTQSGRAALGVEVSTVANPDGTAAGAGIVAVTAGGPAAKAGLVAGDVITAINGAATPDAQALSGVLATLRPGQVAKVSVIKVSGARATVRVTLGQLPAG